MDVERKGELESLGYKQELLRDMGAFQNFAQGFSIISILTGAVTLYGAGLASAGPRVRWAGSVPRSSGSRWARCGSVAWRCSLRRSR